MGSALFLILLTVESSQSEANKCREALTGRSEASDEQATIDRDILAVR